ncbi:MAG: hypothetical protein AB7U75_00100 [Hyphomicrobiaceae bacterium]
MTNNDDISTDQVFIKPPQLPQSLMQRRGPLNPNVLARLTSALLGLAIASLAVTFSKSAPTGVASIGAIMLFAAFVLAVLRAARRGKLKVLKSTANATARRHARIVTQGGPVPLKPILARRPRRRPPRILGPASTVIAFIPRQQRGCGGFNGNGRVLHRLRPCSPARILPPETTGRADLAGGGNDNLPPGGR